MCEALPACDLSMGTPRSIGTLSGTAHLHIDVEAYSFYIEAKPDHDPADLCGLITQAEWWGLEVMDEDEDEPEGRYDGSTRIYLTPIVPVGVTEAQRLARIGKVAVAFVLPMTGLSLFVGSLQQMLAPVLGV